MLTVQAMFSYNNLVFVHLNCGFNIPLPQPPIPSFSVLIKMRGRNRHGDEASSRLLAWSHAFCGQTKYTRTLLFSQESLSDTDTHTYLEKYLDDSRDYGELGELYFTEDLYSFIEQFLYITKQTAVHTEN